MPPSYCPNCGSEVPANAKACPGCGSCDETGWSEETLYDGLDLPDDTFDYDEYIKKEFSHQSDLVPYGISPVWWLVAIVVLLAMLAWALPNLF